jgi:hypothetical protein
MHFRDIADHAAADGVITAEEILALRQAGWSDGRIRPDEAEALFAINDAVSDVSCEWSDFFVEALGEFIVNTLEPKGYVTDEQGEWLVARIDHDGKVDSLVELELLVRVFERATSVPQRLRDYALAQIERAVLTGEGPTRCGGGLEKGNVTEAEAKLMRRIIFASGSDRPAGVSRAEADMLYRIKDAALDSANSPEWKRLFVQGVGNYLVGFADHTAVSRERAAELEAFMNDHRPSLGRFAARMAKSTVSGNFFDSIGYALGMKDGDEGPSIDERVEADRAVTTNEQMWLEGKIDGNDQVDEYDQAVLDFLEEESGFTR